ncbi:MAG: HAMP domain-containing histidine kinase [Anaerolineaceae bacterium]|nr:HAMP domain-containing histidine kinase [Anaerolineaceae bacterium]
MKKNWQWIIALLPLAAGIILRVLAGFHLLPNPVIYLRGAWTEVFLLFTILVSGLMIAFMLHQRRRQLQHQREINDLIHDAQHDRQQFLQRLDHELKNPLTTLRSDISNLRIQLNDPSDAASLDSVAEQTERITNLVSDLRKLASFESIPFEFVPVDLTVLLRDLVDQVLADHPERTATIHLTLPQAPWPLPKLVGDGDLIYLALYNVLDNALKFTQAGDTIEIRGSETGSQVSIEIADTGCGIEAGDLPFVWDELFRGKQAHGKSGSGLGLAMVRAIIERHHGSVDVHSRLGDGTVFHIELPVTKL